MTELHAVTLLEAIDNELNSRILELKKLNDRYRSILNALDTNVSDGRDIMDSKRDNESSKEKDSNDTADDNATSDINLPAGLDDILLMAKNVRNRQPASNMKKKSEIKKGKDPVSLKSIADKSKPTSAARVGEEIPLAQRKKNAALATIHNQLKLLDNAGLTNPYFLTLPSRTLISSEARLLSALCGRPFLPPSDLLRIVGVTLWPTHSHQHGTYAEATAYLRSARSEYDKALKSKLRRVPVWQLHDDEIRQLFVWWVNIRRCYHIFDALENDSGLRTAARKSIMNVPTTHAPSEPAVGRDAASDVVRLRGLVRDMILPVLPHAPVALPHIPPRGIMQNRHGSCSSHSSYTTKEWVRYARQVVSDYHRAVQSRVCYACETVISKLVLRAVIQQIKACCKLSAEHDEDGANCATVGRTNRDDAILQKWVKALQQYQSVEACLLHAATSMSSTMFFMKRSK